MHGSAWTMAELYRRYATDCLKHVFGPMSVAIVDIEAASALLAVDRMGTRALCYANPHGNLVFGSTAEAIANHPGVGRQLSRQAVFDYLYSHVVPSPRTIYEGVHKLQPAECIVFQNGVIDRRFYWQLRYEASQDATPADLERRLDLALREAVNRSLGHDDDVGAFLSGGTDSSTVAGLMTELRGRPAKTYSIGFRAEGFDEMEYARIAARHFGTASHEYYLVPQDVVKAIPIIATSYDEPFGNDSAVPTYFCAKLARDDGVRVMLAGDGGDEIFGGNARYAKQRLFEAYRHVPAPLRRHLIEPLSNHVGPAGGIPPLRKFRSYVQQASVPLPDRLEAYNFLNREPLSAILESEFLNAINPSEPLSILRDAYERTTSRSYIDRMMHLDLKHALADNDLRKVSTMCRAAGVEVRYPLLDDALVEFTGEIPSSLKVKGVKLRHLFKQTLRNFLPPEIISKRKHGFGMPFGLWLAEHRPLAELVNESLRSFQQRGVVKPDYIATLLRHHETGHATYFGTMIWVIMMLEQWLSERRM